MIIRRTSSLTTLNFVHTESHQTPPSLVRFCFLFLAFPLSLILCVPISLEFPSFPLQFLCLKGRRGDRDVSVSSRYHKMCPLRLILVFLSAAFAGFLLLKGVKSTQDEIRNRKGNAPIVQEGSQSLLAKVWSALCSAFWIFVDMASGRYLWTNLKYVKERSD